MTKVDDLYALGQSVWYDNIRRALLDSGELKGLVDRGVKGVTSNPSIFEKAIAGSTDYDEELHRLVLEGNSVEGIYEALVLEDIRRTADILRPIYRETAGVDGYVSLEVSPTLAHDTKGTIEEARRLFNVLDRANVMIKVPATQAGLPAIEALIAEGINVNVTLIFSIKNYEQVVEAYLRGLERLAEFNGDLSRVASVASFFVSRVDSAVDQELEATRDDSLMGKIAIANAKVAYARFGELFHGDRWERLASMGARVQRPLWASTSTKNPLYPDTLYVDSLVGPNTVNTVPPATLQAFFDHGMPTRTIDTGLEQAQIQLDRLSALGVDLDAITTKLQKDGVNAFAKSFEALMTSIAEKRERLLAGWDRMPTSLGAYQPLFEEALEEVDKNQILPRIWKHDHTVWKQDPTEITNRLGWLRSPEIMLNNLHKLKALVDSVRREGYTTALLLGMGGSSLAPEVFRKTFGVREDYLDLEVLDSTDPGEVVDYAERLDLGKTLFLVATKSGGTVETLSFFKFFYKQVVDRLGEERAGEHFVAITDPGSQLADMAERYRFRVSFLNDPNIGGRYSALSYFGLVPAALIGVDVPKLLDRALAMASGCESCVGAKGNPAVQLGVVMGELAQQGRDKVTFVVSPQIESFGDWVEQLIAESTGKEGKGILPVVGESLGTPNVYGSDRLFVVIQVHGDDVDEMDIAALEKAGHPVVRINLHDRYDLGGQFFLWMLATAIAGQRMGINPFDQPNVEAAKVLAGKMVAEYIGKGAIPEDGSVAVASDVLNEFLEMGEFEDAKTDQGTGYVALQAYVRPTAETASALNELRIKIRDQTRMATTVGYGPRFLHSTGQLHKGDAGNGLFIQFIADDPRDAQIPDDAESGNSSITFGVLKNAQALGDRQALLDAGRRVITFHLDGDVPGNLKKLVR